MALGDACSSWSNAGKRSEGGRRALGIHRLLLDSGGLSAVASGDLRALAIFEKAVAQGIPIAVPVVVIAESTRGTARDAGTNRLLKAIGRARKAIIPLSESTARTAGRLLHAARSSETIDAIVVAEASNEGGSAILTSDTSDLGRLATGLNVTIIAA